jgi:hypothetical protein
MGFLTRPFLERRAIRRALKRPPPANQDIFADIPPDTNHYFIYLHDTEGQKRFIVRSIDEAGVFGPWFDDSNQPGQDRHLSNDEIRGMGLSFLHIYGKARFKYTTAWSFFWAVWTCYPARAVLWDELQQSRFNRTKLVRADRMRVLQHFFRSTIETPGYHPSVVSFMADMYSLRSMMHPRYDETQGYYELVLDSLVQSGELSRNGVAYSMSDSAIPTLEKLQGEKERHDDSIKQQRRIGGLTRVLIAVALIQAVITIWVEMHADPVPPPAGPIVSR